MTAGGSLERLFSPRSVAVVGASSSPQKAGGALVKALRGFPGDLYPVNPRASRVRGLTCYPSVADVPRPVDLALLAVPAGAVAAVLGDCGSAAVGAAVVLSGGFAESGPAGAALQHQVVAAARAAGVRLLGPNTSGFVVPGRGLAATFMAAARELPAGRLAVVAQSGGVNLAISFLAAGTGAGLSLAVGLGNAADVDAAAVLDHLADDADTTAVALHLEGVADGRALMAAVRRVSATKPVVALKVGRSDVGDFARSHTGALAGDWAVARAALRSAGAVVVDSLTDLVAAATALSVTRLGANPRPGVGVVTGQAGPGLIIADGLADAGVHLPELAPATRSRLSQLLPPLTYQANPVDTGRPEATFPAVVDTVAADPAVDAVLVYCLLEPQTELTLAALAAAPRDPTAVPLVVVTGGPVDVLTRQRTGLHASGIPTADSPDRGAFVVGALVADAVARSLARVDAATDGLPPVPVGVPLSGSGALDEDEGKLVLSRLGLRVPARRVCADSDQAHRALAELRVPLVVKVLDAHVTHKAAAGGVRLGVRTPEDLDAALAATAGAASSADSVRWLVEEQAEAGPELIVGGVRDPSFGPVVAVGAGGGDVDLLPPPVLVPAPLAAAEAAAAVARLPRAVLAGLDRLPGAAGELAEILVVVGELLAGHPQVSELDVNPVRFTPTGPVALDAVIVLDAASRVGAGLPLPPGGTR